MHGASHILNSGSPPIICFEWNEKTATSMGYHVQQISSYLAEFGYKYFLSDKKELIPFAIRTDIENWSPMVWAIKPTLHAKRIKISQKYF
jgi:hypothetical protein